jgi:adenosylhomocysteine nucleosidase
MMPYRHKKDKTMTKPPLRLGIISALHQEQAGLIDSMHPAKTTNRGMRNYVSGNLWGIDSVCVLSRIGKVAAAATVATLIERFKVTHIVFTGVAGSADPQVRVGDIVIAESLLQHDLDASPLFPRFEVPLLGLANFASDRYLSNLMANAASQFLEKDFIREINDTDRATFQLDQPRIHRGLVASGDEFIDSQEKMIKLKRIVPDLLAVEMEGAAVAQVCFEFGIPFAVVRTISDRADENSPFDFMHFIEKVAARYAFGLINRLCNH